MKFFLSDRSSPVGQALESLGISKGYEPCREEELENADIVILCARQADPMTLEDGSFYRLFATVDHHLKSAFFYSRRAANAMMPRKEGAIVLIGSQPAAQLVFLRQWAECSCYFEIYAFMSPVPACE